ncbi:MAG: hypothetical protein Q9183_001950 [Haloplaca sp. 2 TL-2023]
MSVTRASLFSQGIHSGMSIYAVATTIGKRMRDDDLRAEHEVAPKKPRMGSDPYLNARIKARHRMELKNFYDRRELRVNPTTTDTGDGLMEYLNKANHKPLMLPLFGSTMEERRASANTTRSPATPLSSRGTAFDYNSASPSQKRMWNRMVHESMGDLPGQRSLADSPPRKRLRSSGSTSPSGSVASSTSPLSESSRLSADDPVDPLRFVGSLARQLQIQNRRPPRSAANAATGETQRRPRRARRDASTPTVRTPNNELDPAIGSTGPRDVFDMTSSPLLNMEAVAEARHQRTLATARANNSAANAPAAQRRRSTGNTRASVVDNAANIQAGQRQQPAGNNVAPRRAPGSPSPAQHARLAGSTNGQNRANNTARPRASRNLGSLPITPIRMETASSFAPGTRSIRSAAPTPPDTASTALATAPVGRREVAQPQHGPNHHQEAPVTVTEIMAALERLQVRAEEEPSANLDRQISDLLAQLRLMEPLEVEEDDSWIAD